jgi:hypothetical protein
VSCFSKGFYIVYLKEFYLRKLCVLLKPIDLSRRVRIFSNLAIAGQRELDCSMNQVAEGLFDWGVDQIRLLEALSRSTHEIR